MRRLRVSLRAFMLGLAAMAVALGIWMDRARRERIAIRWVEARGGRLIEEDQLDEDGAIRTAARPPGPAWVRRWLGDAYFRRIGRVDLAWSRGAIDPDGLRHLVGLSGLRWLRLGNPTVDDRHLARVGRLTDLEELDLENTRVTDRGLAHLADLRRLRDLGLAGTSITDEGLVHLRGLRDLRSLDLSFTKVRGPGLVHLADLRRLESLDLGSTGVDDASLVHLSTLDRLEDLALGREITDAGLAHVGRLAGLRSLRFHESKLTETALDELLSRLPRLEYLGLSYTSFHAGNVARLQRRYPGIAIGLTY